MERRTPGSVSFIKIRSIRVISGSPEARPREEAVNPLLNTHREGHDAAVGGHRAALEDALRRYLHRRLRESEGIDAGFGRDLAGETVRFTLGGGKRMRSLLAWWGWTAGGGNPGGERARSALQACGALELIQTCALVHDDVMDGSPTRRGRPSVHARHMAEHEENGHSGEPRRYGEALAVLVGDLALVWADDMFEEALDGLSRPRGARAVWRGLRTEIMAGQFLDVRAQAGRDRSEGTALRMNLLKTASYSVERPLHLGAAMAGADGATVDALRGYGRDVGTAFQLRDDLLGVYGDPARTGKPVGEDIGEGKCTLLLAAGVRLAGERGDAAASDLLSRVGAGADPAEVADALERLGARDLVRGRCRELAARGAARLDGLDLDPAVLEGLRGLAARTGTDPV
ncbi:polyprenyl synthetase family protein [Nocardiopsis tropica]